MSNVIYLNRKLRPVDKAVKDMLKCMDDLEWEDSLAALTLVQANLMNQMNGDKKLDVAAKIFDLVSKQSLYALESAGWEK